jgi:hypothetical protein
MRTSRSRSVGISTGAIPTILTAASVYSNPGQKLPDTALMDDHVVQQELLIAYRARATVLLTLPYHVAIVAYGVWAWPWRTVDNWDLIAVGAFASFIAALGLANGVQFLYFSRLAGRIIAFSK